MKIRGFLYVVLLTLLQLPLLAQSPVSYSSSEVFQRILKLKVLGSVLYLAAHPDDENNRLLAWLSKDQLYRTGYLSLTRGDGGQNLIGNEQGIELGLIRTQELLAARNIDGAEQFFTRAFDFGFSKSTEEAIRIWERNKILSDIVWVIRKFQPDVIITRFPRDKRAGHGQHSASAVLGEEAYRLAADPKAYPEQMGLGVKPWQARRIVWNNYNFSGDAIPEGSLVVDAGGYNPTIGKSYGEIAAESRSQHKSQGFGVSASRGPQIESFTHIAGSEAKSSLLEGVSTGWERIHAPQVASSIDRILKSFSFEHPSNSLSQLVSLYKQIKSLPSSEWKNVKAEELNEIIAICSGIWMDAYASQASAVQGDSIEVNFSFNNRLGINARLKNIAIEGKEIAKGMSSAKNHNVNFKTIIRVADDRPISQPYWLKEKMSSGSYNVSEQKLIGKPEADPAFEAKFSMYLNDELFNFFRPVLYKHTDPVNGEIYQPLVVLPPINISLEPDIVLMSSAYRDSARVHVAVSANRKISSKQFTLVTKTGNQQIRQSYDGIDLEKGSARNFVFPVGIKKSDSTQHQELHTRVELEQARSLVDFGLNKRIIRYDHIPQICYFREDGVKLIDADIRTAGKKIGYIAGAGDKVPAALELMGYQVTMISDDNLNSEFLRPFDAIITGIRAYNVDQNLTEKKEVLNDYVKNGGNLIVQYNTNNNAGPLRAAIGPYPFEVSRSRVTDETAQVKFLLPNHPVLNFPNKITNHDFDHWIQERAIYFAEQPDKAFVAPLSMKDPGEDDQTGSLIIADYGKGKFVYTGLVFFRELPAGVPGAYRLLANIIALNQQSRTHE